MSESENPFEDLPGFKETIARIARIPVDPSTKKLPDAFVYAVNDQANLIIYKLISPRKLSPADVRRALVKAFTRTDIWPNESGEVEILL